MGARRQAELIMERLAGPQAGDYVVVTTTNGGRIEGILVDRSDFIDLLVEGATDGDCYMTSIHALRVRKVAAL